MNSKLQIKVTVNWYGFAKVRLQCWRRGQHHCHTRALQGFSFKATNSLFFPSLNHWWSCFGKLSQTGSTEKEGTARDCCKHSQYFICYNFCMKQKILSCSTSLNKQKFGKDSGVAFTNIVIQRETLPVLFI